MELAGKLIKIIFSVFFIAILSSCEDDNNVNPNNSIQQKKEPLIIKTPDFSEDSAFAYIKKQVDFGPRVPNSKAHNECSEWMINFFKNLNWEVTPQRGVQIAYDNEQLIFTNVIAKYKPELKNRILLSAHWDTRPWADQDITRKDEPIDGANDGGSGVGVILELARLITLDSLDFGIDVVLFDIEDYGISEVNNSFCYGSQYWYNNYNPNQIKPLFGINLDMVGDSDAVFMYEGFSVQYARPILDRVWKSAEDLKFDKYFERRMSGAIIDDHLWVNKTGIPCIDIIHKNPVTQGFPDTWHTHNDNINNISKNTLNAVGTTVLQVIYRLHNETIN